MNFSTWATPGPTAPTAGRSLNHVGFRVRGLEALFRHIASDGSAFEPAYTKTPDGVATARLTDPWGTSIEFTEERVAS